MRDSLLFFGKLHGLDREVRLLRTIETDHHRVELLANLETVGALLVTITAKVGALDEAGCSVLTGLHFEAAIADFEHRHGRDGILGKAAR